MISIPEKWLFWRQMCWSFSSFVIKSGCTSKESWDCGDKMLSSGERRRKPTGTQSLKFCDKTWTVQNRRLKGFHYSVLHSLEPMSFSVITARAPDFQNFKNWIWDLEETTRVWQELGSWTFLFSNLRSVVLVLKETMTEQALPPALLLEIRRPEFSPNPQCKLWRCSIQSELRLQIWYLDFCPWWWILPPQYWRRHHSSGPLWSRRRIQRIIMMWPSPPLLSCSTQIQHSLLKFNFSSQIAEAILSQQRFSLFHKCAFRFSS